MGKLIIIKLTQRVSYVCVLNKHEETLKANSHHHLQPQSIGTVKTRFDQEKSKRYEMH